MAKTRAYELKKLEAMVRNHELWLLELQSYQDRMCNNLKLQNEKLREEMRSQNEKMIEEMRELLRIPAPQRNDGREQAEAQILVPQDGWYKGTTKIRWLDFLKFNSEELEGWVYRIKQFFEFNETKLKLVSIHLEGKAFYWHQTYIHSLKDNDEPLTWDGHLKANNIALLCTRAYDDPMFELKNLVQTGTLEAYLDEFDVLWN